MINPVMHQAPSTGTVKDLAELVTLNKKDLLPDWNLAKFNGNPLQWHEWHGQFKSAIDSQALSDDIKLTYLKTLVVGKAKDAIAEFAYCGKMYRDALKTLDESSDNPKQLSLLTLTNWQTTLQLRCTALIKSSIFPQLSLVLLASSGLCPMMQIFRVHHS